MARSTLVSRISKNLCNSAMTAWRWRAFLFLQMPDCASEAACCRSITGKILFGVYLWINLFSRSWCKYAAKLGFYNELKKLASRFIQLKILETTIQLQLTGVWQLAFKQEKVLDKYGARIFRIYEIFLAWSVMIGKHGGSTANPNCMS